MSSWNLALKEWNSKTGQTYRIPSKGTPEHAAVLKIQASLPKFEKKSPVAATPVAAVAPVAAVGAGKKTAKKKVEEAKSVSPVTVEVKKTPAKKKDVAKPVDVSSTLPVTLATPEVKVKTPAKKKNVTIIKPVDVPVKVAVDPFDDSDDE